MRRNCSKLYLPWVLVAALIACGDDGGGDTTNTDASTGTTASESESGTGAEGSGDTGGAGLTCLEIRTCLEECTTPGCEPACFEMGSPTGQAEFEAVSVCFDDNQVMGSLDIAESCAAEIAACIANESGDGNCQMVDDCSDACGDDEACEQQCFDEGTTDAQVQWIQLMFCVEEFCPTLAPDCVMNAAETDGECLAYADACFG